VRASSSSPVRGPWARASSDTGHGSLARVLEGFGLGRGVLWVGSGAVTMVGDVQRAGEEERGGPGCCLLFSSLSHSLGRGRRSWAQPRRRPGAWLQALDERRQ
jgi:hypothetical protein